MRRHPWFWGTLSLWFLLGSAGTLGALWWGGFSAPVVLSARMMTEVNSHPVEISCWNAGGDLPTTTEALSFQWTRQGWIPLGGGRNIAPDLLGISPGDPEGQDAIAGGCRILLFQRKREYRLLALLRLSDGNTSALTADIPAEALEGASADLPDGIRNSQVVLAQGMEAWVWQSIYPADRSEYLFRWARSRGWSLDEWIRTDRDRLFLARRNSQSYLLTVSPKPGGSQVTWISIPSGGPMAAKTLNRIVRESESLKRNTP